MFLCGQHLHVLLARVQLSKPPSAPLISPPRPCSQPLEFLLHLISRFSLSGLKKNCCRCLKALSPEELLNSVCLARHGTVHFPIILLCHFDCVIAANTARKWETSGTKFAAETSDWRHRSLESVRQWWGQFVLSPAESAETSEDIQGGACWLQQLKSATEKWATWFEAASQRWAPRPLFLAPPPALSHTWLGSEKER